MCTSASRVGAGVVRAYPMALAPLMKISSLLSDRILLPMPQGCHQAGRYENKFCGGGAITLRAFSEAGASISSTANIQLPRDCRRAHP